MQMEQLPPGFRFYPTEEELITFYLNNKLHGHGPDLDRVIPSIHIYSYEPSNLPGLAGQVCQGETEQWFFFTPQQEREARGGRPNRTTNSGYWKATGSPSCVYSQNKVIGVKKTMVFYKGKAPTGRKTKWKMNEYKAIKQDDIIMINNNTNLPSLSNSTIPELRHELSLCRVYITSGCARAFDRRPPGGLMSTPNIHSQNVANRNTQGQGNGTSSQNTDPTAVFLMEGSSCTDSSNSGGNDHTTLLSQEAAAGSSNNSNNTFEITMAQDLEPLLNWEQLNWL